MPKALAQEIAHFRDELREAVNHVGFRGIFNLDHCERRVFTLRHDRFPAQMATYMAWLNFCGFIEGSSFSPQAVSAARGGYPSLVGSIFDAEAFAGFAMIFGGLTRREADAIFYREWFLRARCGEITFCDEHPAQAHETRAPRRRERAGRKG